MKTRFWFLGLIFSAFLSQAQVVNIPDAVFKNILLTYSPKIDVNNNGQIEVSEATIVTNLNVGNGNIQNSTGIEAFINLDRLIFDYSNFSSLNISNLKYLKILSLHLCKNLTYVDLTNNPLLADLNIEASAISQINVSNNSELMYLNVQRTNILALNITNLSKLIDLKCRSTKISQLNLINCLQLQRITCHNTQLTSLDLSKNIKLTYVYTGSPNLTQICVSPTSVINSNWIKSAYASWSTTCRTTTIWNGTTWSAGIPTPSTIAIINGNYSTATNGNISCYNLSIAAGFTLNVLVGGTVTVANNFVNNGTSIKCGTLAVTGTSYGNINTTYQKVTSAITSPTSVCPYQTNAVFSVTSNPLATYTWSLSSATANIVGNRTGNSITVNLNGSSIGSQTVSVVEKNGCGTNNQQVNKTFTVLEPVANAATCDVFPKPISANGVSFNGFNQGLIIPASNKMGFGYADFTIEFILKSDMVISNNSRNAESLISNNNGGNGYIDIYMNRATNLNDADAFTFNTGASYITAVKNIKDGKCHHFALCKNSSYTYLYIDGVLFSNGINTNYSPTGNTTQPYTIGSANTLYQDFTSYQNVFNGLIKEFRTWNIYKNQVQIQSSMNKALYGNETGLVGYWPFNEGSGQILNDKTTLPNNGYLGSSVSNTSCDPIRSSAVCTISSNRFSEEKLILSEDVTFQNMNAFPNPFSSSFSLSLPDNLYFNIQIFNNVGFEVYNLNSANGIIQIGTDLTSGYYIVKVTGNGQNKIFNVLKK